MKKAIVTGGTGFLGRNLIRRLCEENYQIYAVVRPSSPNLSLLPVHENVICIPCALEELPGRQAQFPRDCDAFYHFAWGGVNREEIDNASVHQSNMETSLAAVRFAIETGCQCFVDAGSRSEYGAHQGPFREDLECHPLVAYGRTKLAFSKKAAEICRGTGTRFIHARMFSVYGADDHPWSLIYTAVTRMLRNEPISLSSCKQLWNFMDVRDTSDLLLTLSEKKRMIPEDDNGIFNVATSDIRPLRDFVEEIKRITNSSSDLQFGTFNQGADSGMSILPDMTKVERVFGWKPQVTFEEGIRHMICMLEGDNHA